MKTRMLILTSLFAALTAVGALISVPLPFTIVPITLQSLFTLLAGILLGSRYGALSQLVYLLLGGIGLPVFAGGSGGFQALVGPSSGYLWGFVLAAYVAGLISERKPNVLKDLAALFVGLIIIYVCGISGLHWIAGLTWTKAFTLGVVPFLIGDLIKIGLAAFVNYQLREKMPYFYENK